LKRKDARKNLNFEPHETHCFVIGDVFAVSAFRTKEERADAD
jgi:hypothetical protein